MVAAAGGCVGIRGDGTPRTRTTYGVVRGFVRNGASIFLGMPYGASTAGNRRFLPPTEPSSWTGERDATRFGQRAPQPVRAASEAAKPIYSYFTGGRQSDLEVYGDPMGEDCLVLNVLTPATDGAGRPVLFYIHGGGFTSGSGNVMTLCERLVMEEDLVVVTVNHRLGPMGFMYLGGLSSEFSEGNPGMLDLVAALRWVRDNIAAFGGAPEKVTLFGESGGGAKIALLNTMPQAEGLFRSAIVQSGFLPEPEKPSNVPVFDMLQNLGLDKNGVARLQSLHFKEIISAARGKVGDRPIADGKTLSADAWKRAPKAAANIPMIVGYCADELTLFFPQEFLHPLEWSSVVAKIAERLDHSEVKVAPVLRAYRDAYPEANTHDIYSRILSDATFGRDMVNLADRKSIQQPPVYFYRLEYTPPSLSFLRSFHTVGLPLVGRMVSDPHAEGISQQLGRAWAAFARSGDPNHPGLPEWRSHGAEHGQVMLFGEQSKFVPDPQHLARSALLPLVTDDLRDRLLRGA